MLLSISSIIYNNCFGFPMKNWNYFSQQKPVLLLLRKAERNMIALKEMRGKKNYFNKKYVVLVESSDVLTHLWNVKSCTELNEILNRSLTVMEKNPSVVSKSFFIIIVTYVVFTVPLSLHGPVWHSVWRHTTVFFSWWLPMQYPCGFGWMSLLQQQMSTAVIDLFPYVTGKSFE